MPASTGATGVPANNRTPAVFLSIAFGASPNGSGGGPLKCLMLGFKTSGGSGTADTTIYHLTNGLADALTFAGQNSMAYLMAKAGYAIAPACDMYLGFPAEPSGATASCLLTVGSSNASAATGSGNITVTIGGVPVVIGVAPGQTADVVSGNVTAALNTSSYGLCVTTVQGTSSNAYKTTVSFKHVGTLGNQIPVTVSIDASVGLTFTTAGAFLGATVAGSGTETLANILTVMQAAKYDIVFAASQDGTNIGRLMTALDTQYTAVVGMPGQGVVCYNGDSTASQSTNLAALTAINASVNDPVMQVMFSSLPTPAFILGAGWAAERSVVEGADPTTVETKFNPAVTDLSAIAAAPSSPSSYLTSTIITSCLNSGITPIATMSDGSSVVVRSITSHYKDVSGNPDARTLDTINVSVPFAFARTIQSDFPQVFGTSTLIDNPAPGGDPVPSGVTWPDAIKTHYHAIALDLSRQTKPWLTNIALDYANWQFNLDATVPGRVDATTPITTVQWVAQFSAAIQQLTLL